MTSIIPQICPSIKNLGIHKTFSSSVYRSMHFLQHNALKVNQNKKLALHTNRLNHFSITRKISRRKISRSGLQLLVLLIYVLRSSTCRVCLIFLIPFAFDLLSARAHTPYIDPIASSSELFYTTNHLHTCKNPTQNTTYTSQTSLCFTTKKSFIFQHH